MKTFCAAQLPAYMSPDRFVFHDRLPRTSTDKVDYQTLAPPDRPGRRVMQASVTEVARETRLAGPQGATPEAVWHLNLARLAARDARACWCRTSGWKTAPSSTLMA